MAPTIFSYKSIKIRVFPKDHEPVHVHAFSGSDFGVRIVFTMMEGKVVKVEYKKLKGFKPFGPALVKDLKKLVERYKDEMANDFIDVVHRKMSKNKKIITKIV